MKVNYADMEGADAGCGQRKGSKAKVSVEWQIDLGG